MRHIFYYEENIFPVQGFTHGRLLLLHRHRLLLRRQGKKYYFPKKRIISFTHTLPLPMVLSHQRKTMLLNMHARN